MKGRVNKRYSDIIFWTVIAVILLLQARGLMFGLPGQYHPDEYYVNIYTFKLFRELKTLNFSVTYYILGVRWFYFAGICLSFLLGSLFGVFESFSGFYALYFSSGNPFVDAAPPLFYFVPRVISYLFYCGTAILVYFVLRCFFTGQNKLPSKVGCLAAVLLPAGYLYGHYGTRESAICFFSLLAVYHSYVHFKPERLKTVIAGAVILGFTVGVKENGGIFFFLYGLHLFLSFIRKEITLKKLIGYCLLMGLIMSVVFILLNPQWLALKNVEYLSSRYTGSRVVTTTLDRSEAHLIYPKIFIREFSFIGLPLLIIGGTLAWLKIKTLRPLVVIITASYLALDLVKYNGYNKADRFIINIFPLLLVAGTAGLSIAAGLGRRRHLLWLLPVLIGGGNMYELFSIYHVLNGYDTRDEAKIWIDQNVPEGSVLAKEIIFTPYIDEKKFEVKEKRWMLSQLSVDSLRSLDVEYCIISDRYVNGWVGGDQVRENYLELRRYAVKEFHSKCRPTINDFHSPDIFICRL